MAGGKDEKNVKRRVKHVLTPDIFLPVLGCVSGNIFTFQTTMKSVIISGHHLLLTPAIKSLTEEKFERLFNHNSRINRAKVEFEEERCKTSPTKLMFTAKAILEGINVVASATAEDLYKSIDLLVRKLDGQLRRRHGVAHSRRKYALQAA
jgi:putative sigma-54 modulation protein